MNERRSRVRKHWDEMGRLGKVAVIALAVLFGLELLYLITANAVLNTSLFEKVVGGDTTRARLGSGYSIVPGQLHLEDLEITSRGENVDYWLSVDEVDGFLNLVPLLFQHFSASDVTASGVRLRVSGQADNALRQRAFPQIEEVAPRAMQVRTPRATYAAAFAPPNSASSGDADGWSIDLEDVSATTEELWVLEYRHAGEALVTGGFSLTPGEQVRVDSSRIDFRGGRLSFGDVMPIAKDVRGSASADVAAHTGWTARQLVENLSFTAELDVMLQSARFASAYVEPRIGLSFDRGQGPLLLDVTAEDGRLLSGSELTYKADTIELVRPPLRSRGPVEVRFQVPDEGEASARFSLVQPEATISTTGETEAEPAQLSGLELRLQTATAKLTPAWDPRGELQLRQVRLPDLRLLNAFAAPQADWSVRGGSGTASARLELLPSDRMQGTVRVRAEAADVQVGELAVQGNTSVTAELLTQPETLTAGTIRKLHVALRDAAVTTNYGVTEDWWMTLSSDALHYEGMLPYYLAGPFQAELDSTRPVVDALKTVATLPRLGEDMFYLDQLKLTGRLWHRQQSWDVVIRQATSGAIQAQGRWHREPGEGLAAFIVRKGEHGLGFAVTPEGTAVKYMADQRWLEEKTESFPELPAQRELVGGTDNETQEQGGTNTP